MTRKVGNRRGFTLTELVVTMALVSTVVAIGAVILSNDEQDTVKNAATDALAFLRTARNVATRQGNAVVVVVWKTGADPGEGQTAGKMAAYMHDEDTCPTSSPVGGEAEYELEWIQHNGLAYEGAGITRIVPTGEDTIEICFRPNGRVVNREDQEPFDGSEDVDFSGNAEIWFQYGPLTDPGGTLPVPRAQIIIPYTGLMRMVQ